MHACKTDFEFVAFAVGFERSAQLAQFLHIAAAREVVSHQCAEYNDALKGGARVEERRRVEFRLGHGHHRFLRRFHRQLAC